VLLKNPVALKVLVWSRGRLVTLQILTSSSFSLVKETHGSLGQCVSFSLIDVGSGFTAYIVFLFFFLRDITDNLFCLLGDEHCFAASPYTLCAQSVWPCHGPDLIAAIPQLDNGLPFLRISCECFSMSRGLSSGTVDLQLSH